MQGDTAGADVGNDIASGGGASTSSQGPQNATYIGADIGSLNTSMYKADSADPKNGFGPACVKSPDGNGPAYPGSIESVVAVKQRQNQPPRLVVNRYASDGRQNAQGEISQLVQHFKLLLAGSSSKHEQPADFADIFKLLNGVQLFLMPQRCQLALAWRCAARVAHALSARPPPEMLCTLMCGSSLAAALQQRHVPRPLCCAQGRVSIGGYQSNVQSVSATVRVHLTDNDDEDYVATAEEFYRAFVEAVFPLFDIPFDITRRIILIFGFPIEWGILSRLMVMKTMDIALQQLCMMQFTEDYADEIAVEKGAALKQRLEEEGLVQKRTVAEPIAAVLCAIMKLVEVRPIGLCCG